MLLAITDQTHIFLSSILRQIVKTVIGEKKKNYVICMGLYLHNFVARWGFQCACQSIASGRLYLMDALLIWNASLEELLQVIWKNSRIAPTWS